jgi:hypothetical protein
MSEGGERNPKPWLVRLAQAGAALVPSAKVARRVAGGTTITVLAVLISAAPGRAEGAARLLARGGDWAAVEYPPANPASSTVCAAVDPTARLVLSAEGGRFEIELGNWHWALPSSASGSVEVRIDSTVRSFPFTRNTSNTVAVAIDPTVLPELLGEMESAASMRIIIGRVGSLYVPLAGSGGALSAFKACSGIGRALSDWR